MKGYKGFNKGLICEGKQYAENTVFEEDRVQIYFEGMTFCEIPCNIFDRFCPAFNNEFCEVEADEAVTDEIGERFWTKKLKVGKKISVFDICDISINTIRKKYGSLQRAEHSSVFCNSQNAIDGKYESAIVTRKQSGIAVTDCNAIVALGNSAIHADCGNAIGAQSFSAIETGDGNAIRAKSASAIRVTNDNAIAIGSTNATSTGSNNVIIASNQNDIHAGDHNVILAKHGNQIEAGIDSVVAVSSDNEVSVGSRCIAVAYGTGNKIKGKKMSLLIFAMLDDDGNISGYSCNVVDGTNVKEDTYYTLNDQNVIIEADD